MEKRGKARSKRSQGVYVKEGYVARRIAGVVRSRSGSRCRFVIKLGASMFRLTGYAWQSEFSDSLSQVTGKSSCPQDSRYCSGDGESEEDGSGLGAVIRFTCNSLWRVT